MNSKIKLIVLPLLGLFGFNSNLSSQDTLKLSGGFEISKVINKKTEGFSAGIYFSNSNIQIGYVMESNQKAHSTHPGKGIDLLKCGIEANYFPFKMNIIRPYLGSEIKYEHESYFMGKENDYQTKQGLGLEFKLGTEIKPFKQQKIRAFAEGGYTFLIDKKSEGYPNNPEVKRDKFIALIGLRF